MRASKKPYACIDRDIDDGMTVTGRIIRNTRAFDRAYDSRRDTSLDDNDRAGGTSRP